MRKTSRTRKLGREIGSVVSLRMSVADAFDFQAVLPALALLAAGPGSIRRFCLHTVFDE